ncbi:MAG TPA: nuclear transport factor 2 family protein, partial [Acidimicrobiales bacterium]|nr:nuclear transport factor 2 family protein [Acidimicrobiales bacterium]
PRAARGPGRTLRGHDELAEVVVRIARYDTTFHLLGQTRVTEVDGTAARAETYCVAHHWRALEGRTEDTVLYIRYEDDYRLGADGAWRLRARRLHEDARQVHEERGPVGRVVAP